MQRVEKLAAHLLKSQPAAMSRPPITSHVLDTGTGSEAPLLAAASLFALPLRAHAHAHACAEADSAMMMTLGARVNGNLLGARRVPCAGSPRRVSLWFWTCKQALGERMSDARTTQRTHKQSARAHAKAPSHLPASRDRRHQLINAHAHRLKHAHRH